jgi:hypothetical protein
MIRDETILSLALGFTRCSLFAVFYHMLSVLNQFLSS